MEKKRSGTKKPAKSSGARKTTAVKTKSIKKTGAKAKTETKKSKVKAEKTTIKKTSKISAAEKAGKKELKTIAFPKKAARLPQMTLKKISEEAEISSVKAGSLPKGLPAEYRENRITLMIVTPWKLFAYWEIKKSTLSKTKGTLVLRVYDVTGVSFNGKNATISYDIAVFDRIGDSYIGVGPGRDYIVDIGTKSQTGSFTKIARSNKVITPALKTGEKEGVLTQEAHVKGAPIGYF